MAMIKLLTPDNGDSGYSMCDACKRPSQNEYGECKCDVCFICKKRGAKNQGRHEECTRAQSLDRLKRVLSIVESREIEAFGDVPWMLQHGIERMGEFLSVYDAPEPPMIASGIPGQYPHGAARLPALWRNKK